MSKNVDNKIGKEWAGGVDSVSCFEPFLSCCPAVRHCDEDGVARKADVLRLQNSDDTVVATCSEEGIAVSVGDFAATDVNYMVAGESEQVRREAAAVHVAGKYEPNLTERGIPADVLSKLLPGDDVIELDKPSVAGGIGYRFMKRAFDIVACGCALIALALPVCIIALRIKLESPGPVIFAQRRVGKDGRVFNIYKFRSMYRDAEAQGAQWALKDDPRVTPFGKVMRKTRIDEIPQFWNIMKGDMSLVGPRPERPAFCDEFEKRIHGWHYRTSVRPGLSGLAQMTGGYDLLPKEKVVLDLEYIEHRCVALDLKIILKTLGVVSNCEGAR